MDAGVTGWLKLLPATLYCAPRNWANPIFKVTASNSSQRKQRNLWEGWGEKNSLGNMSDNCVPSNIEARGSIDSRPEGGGVGRVQWVMPSQAVLDGASSPPPKIAL